MRRDRRAARWPRLERSFCIFHSPFLIFHSAARGLASLFAVAIGLAAGPAAADVLLYRLPVASRSVVMLEGATTVNPGGTVSFTHPRYGKIHFDLASVEIHKAPTSPAQFSRVLGRAGESAVRTAGCSCAASCIAARP